MQDIINKPQHYTQGDIDVVDFINDQQMNFMEGNIIKYICRYKFKNGVEDLEKAKVYLNFLIKQQKSKKQKEQTAKD